MTTTATTIIGRWRITSMSTWDKAYIDLVEPGFVTFAARGMGEMAFGAVTAVLDCAFDKSKSDVSFDFNGSDEGDQVSGRGSAGMTGPNTIIGEIEFHMGDETSFKAQRC